MSTYYVPGGVGEGEVSVPVLVRLRKAHPSNIEAMFRGPVLAVSVQGAACHKASKKPPIGEIDVCTSLTSGSPVERHEQQYDLLSPGGEFLGCPRVLESGTEKCYQVSAVKHLLAAVASDAVYTLPVVHRVLSLPVIFLSVYTKKLN